MAKEARLHRLILLGALLACRGPSPEAVHVFPAGGDASSPLVVWLHGRGGRPETYEAWWKAFPAKVEVLIPRAPIELWGGYAWIDWQAGTTDDELAEQVNAAADRLWIDIEKAAHGRKVIVTGFSQGAVITYALAARHPEIGLAIPIAGLLPRKLQPHGQPGAPLFAMHGADDNVIGAAMGKETTEAFAKDGGRAEIRIFPGVGHTLTDEMRAELTARIVAAVR